jgi:predicted Rossmann fold nucleotide-binding protein DprA/Smf involved in DNA uptake
MRAIAKYGAVVTEYPLTERPTGINFPKRNRIISGLCQGVLVIEGAMGSGSLITAAKAESQGRDVFALPGKINESNSEGPNDLIRKGAVAVLDTADILNHYDFLYHDRIDFRSLKEAKSSPYPMERALKDYEVSARAEKIRSAVRMAVPEEAPSAEKPTKTAEGGRLPISPKIGKRSSVRVEEAESSAPAPTAHAEEPTPPVGLDPVCEAVWNAMPAKEAISMDGLAAKGISAADAMMALTLLEVSGYCESLPGGLYRRK